MDKKYIVPLLLTGAGMLGLHFNVEYSGWVLFVGLVAVITV
jgi:hypothetical protein